MSDKEKEPSKNLKLTPKDNKVKVKEVSHFVSSMEDVNEFGRAVEALVPNKYVRDAIFSAMNQTLKPVFK